MPSLAGSFLVARPVLADPSFIQSVVLILQHGEQGAFGLVVNRPARVKGIPFKIHDGGPCRSDELILLHGHLDWIGDDVGDREVAEGIYLGDTSCLEHLNQPKSRKVRYRLFTGYAGWAPDQLENEMAIGAWAVAPATGKLLFDTPASELWNLLCPSSIPQPSIN